VSRGSSSRPWWYSGWQWLGNLTLTESWRWHAIGDQRAHFPAQAWTLCYEEQFYAVVGLLLAISRRRFFSGAR
jgi:peptidoglycan/LPS O-acetylase OafA/YrhL